MDKENLKILIRTMKGIIPANYESMARLVSCVSYLEDLLNRPEKPAEEKSEVKDG